NYATTVQNQLATKANTRDVYNKLYIDTLIAKYYLKTETYNQTEIYNKLALKLNATVINDYYNKLYIDTLIATYDLKTETYNQTEIYNKLALTLNASVIANYYDKSCIDTLIANYYTNTQTYSNTEIDTKLDTKQNLITPSTNLTLGSLTAQTNIITPIFKNYKILSYKMLLILGLQFYQ
ncbi:MAG: hypothetical protein ACKPKO_02475, partial [Candidatus Fonsibacter sp.]